MSEKRVTIVLRIEYQTELSRDEFADEVIALGVPGVLAAESQQMKEMGPGEYAGHLIRGGATADVTVEEE